MAHPWRSGDHTRKLLPVARHYKTVRLWQKAKYFKYPLSLTAIPLIGGRWSLFIAHLQIIDLWIPSRQAVGII